MQDTVQTPRRNLTGAIIPSLGVAGLVAAAALLIVGRGGAEKQVAAPAPADCILENADGVGGPLELVDGNGARVTETDFAGAPAAIYFGFAHCPDVCPATMYTLAEALSQPGAYDVQPVLVTVDPARDTPDVMRAYVQTAGFPAGLVGLTGSEAQIDAAKRAFHVYAARVPGRAGDDPDVYNVDHSSLLYVVDGSWRTVAIIPTMKRADPADPRSPLVATEPATIAACIAAGLERSAD